MNSFGVRLHQLLLVHVAGLELARIHHPREFKSLVSTYFTIRAFFGFSSTTRTYITGVKVLGPTLRRQRNFADSVILVR